MSLQELIKDCRQCVRHVEWDGDCPGDVQICKDFLQVDKPSGDIDPETGDWTPSLPVKISQSPAGGPAGATVDESGAGAVPAPALHFLQCLAVDGNPCSPRLDARWMATEPIIRRFSPAERTIAMALGVCKRITEGAA